MEGGQAKCGLNRLNGENRLVAPTLFPSNQDGTWDQRTRGSELEERGCVPSRPGLRAWARGRAALGPGAGGRGECGIWHVVVLDTSPEGMAPFFLLTFLDLPCTMCLIYAQYEAVLGIFCLQ